jgi:hypothetical protein
VTEKHNSYIHIIDFGESFSSILGVHVLKHGITYSEQAGIAQLRRQTRKKI